MNTLSFLPAWRHLSQRLPVVAALLLLGSGCGKSHQLTTVEPIFDGDAALDFGEVATSAQATQDFNFENIGTAELVIEDVAITGSGADDFQVATGGTRRLIAGGAAAWQVTFAPRAAGAAAATLQLTTNQRGTVVVEIALQGVGIVVCVDADGDGYGAGCALGDDCDDGDDAINPASQWYRDVDHDTYGDPNTVEVGCAAPSGYVDNSDDCNDFEPAVAPAYRWYYDGDSDGFGRPDVYLDQCTQPAGFVANPDDCSDADASITTPSMWYEDQDGDSFGNAAVSQAACTPPANFVADDSDCDDSNPSINPTTTWYKDQDGDGYGDANNPVVSCIMPTGYVGNSGDCDDSDALLNPGTIWYRDADGDTYGNDNVTQTSCAQPPGYVAIGGDCNDNDSNVIPTTTWYADSDGDGFGDPGGGRLACTQPSGYVADNSDCDDNDASAHPGATWWADSDGDTFGDANTSKIQCARDPGWSDNNLDCDDTNAAIGANITWYADQDGDSFGNPNVTQLACVQPVGYVSDNSDCDDLRGTVSPTADELSAAECNDGLDNDCDGEPDQFDFQCAHVDCGDPAYYLTTDACNYDYPANTGAILCEEYPGSPWPSGQKELCMDVCTSRSDCPSGQACYPSRRSLNLHFCAPNIGAGLVQVGGTCSADGDCATAMCHSNVCREVCVRDSDCGLGEVCRQEIRMHAYIGNQIATGICEPVNTSLYPNGTVCGSGAQCRSGVCGTSIIGGTARCRASCATDVDCPLDERCAAAVHDYNPGIGYGYRACAERPTYGTNSGGQSCYSDIYMTWTEQGCRSLFCDTTFCWGGDPFNAATCPIEPYCGTLCDEDRDCPLLFPGNFNLRMRCLVTSTNEIQPLIGGYCSPYFCENDGDCEAGRTCFIFNPSRQDYPTLASGICQ